MPRPSLRRALATRSLGGFKIKGVSEEEPRRTALKGRRQGKKDFKWGKFSIEKEIGGFKEQMRPRAVAEVKEPGKGKLGSVARKPKHHGRGRSVLTLSLENHDKLPLLREVF